MEKLFPFNPLAVSSLRLAACALLAGATPSAQADENLFGFVRGAETLPQGHFDFYQTLTLRTGKDVGVYRGWDSDTEVEYGFTDKLQGSIVPPGGRLALKSVSGRKQEFDLPVESNPPPTFARTLQSMQETFEYRVTLGDAESDPVKVKVKARPGVSSVECLQIFPAYTRLPSRRRTLGDLKILAGSRLALKVRASGPMKSGEIRLVGGDREKISKAAPLTIDVKDHAQLTGEIEVPAKDVAGLTLHLVDEDGVESRGAAIYPIELLADEVPAIKVTWPDRREELLTREATMLIAFTAKDDYGVARVRLNYAVDWVEGAPHKTIDLDVGAALPKEISRRFNWRVGQITPHVEEGSVIDYWFEVLDANDVTGPGVGTTEHMQARIVSDAEKRADLANRLSDTMEGLNGVKHGQEDVNQQLGEIIFEKPAGK